MKLAFVNLTGGGLSGGYKKYLYKLIPYLKEDPRISQLEIFVPQQALDDIKRLERNHWLCWPKSNPITAFNNLKQQIKRLNPDIVFIPTSRWADFEGIPTVTMLRNMEAPTTPFSGNSFVQGLRNVARAAVTRRTMRRSTRVIAVSDFVKKFIVSKYHLDPSNIDVVYHGVDLPGSLDKHRKPDALVNIKAGEFIFTAGSIRPYQRLEDVIKAMRILVKSGFPYELVVAGAPDAYSRYYKNKMTALARNLGVAKQIIWAGWLSEEEMAWCYSRCRLFVMTSRVEACPNVVLETLAHGCLSVSSDAPPMPEFFGDSACYYNVGDHSGLARRVLEAIGSSDSERRIRRELAKEIASGFSWEKTAAQTVSVLEKCL